MFNLVNPLWLLKFGRYDGPGFDWTKALDGKDPIIDKEYARVLLALLDQAIRAFMSPSAHGEPSSEFIDAKGGTLNVFLVNVVLKQYLNQIAHALAEQPVLASPYILAKLMKSNAFLRKHKLRSLAAYSVYCVDQTLGALSTNDALFSAQASGYAFHALSMAWGHQFKPSRRRSPGWDAPAVAERSRLARYAAKVRHAAPKSLEARQFVSDCLAERGRAYKTKAAFIRDMRDKLGDKIKSDKTIAKYIDESGYKVPHWRTRRMPSGG